MILSFGNAGTQEVYDGEDTRAARRTCPPFLWRVAGRKLQQMDRVGSVEDLRVPPGNRLKRLQGERIGQYSIRINDQYRICFRWTAEGPEQVEIVDYH